MLLVADHGALRFRPMRRWAPRIGAGALAILLAAHLAAAAYDEQRAAAVGRCEAIDPGEYQSGLLFNPDGYRSYFVRSECFQLAAKEFRDASLCAQVRERRSLFGSSWGYSPVQCRKEVQAGASADREAIAETRRQYLSHPLRLADFRVERNGNGRDLDLVPLFSGGHAGSYALRFDVLAAGGTAVPLHATGMHLNGRSNVRLYVRAADVRARWPEFALGGRYRVRATLTLDVGPGSAGGRWADAVIEDVFPRADRTSALEKDVAF